jgi:hypothetical protein
MSDQSSDNRIIIPAKGIRSLCWDDNELVDWAAGGARYRLDGSIKRSRVNYAYRFDSAVQSPSCRFAVVYERLGTKALLLDNGTVVRELNRSFYQAHVYDYPICLFALPDGREVIAHCSEGYNLLDIEELETGHRLTTRQPDEPADFFHSRLSVTDGGKYLMSAGWIWHPFDSIALYDIEKCLDSASLLDSIDFAPAHSEEISSAAFVDSTLLFAASNSDAIDFSDDDDEEDSAVDARHGSVSIYDLEQNVYLSKSPVEDDVGTLMPVNLEFAVGFFEFPKLIHMPSGIITYRWSDIASGTALSSISCGKTTRIPIALDGKNHRFAVADDEKITVINIPPELTT